MVLLLVLLTAVFVACKAPAERDRLRKRATLLSKTDTATAHLDASDDRDRADRCDRLAHGALWVAGGVAVLLGLEALSSLVALHG